MDLNIHSHSKKKVLHHLPRRYLELPTLQNTNPNTPLFQAIEAAF